MAWCTTTVSMMVESVRQARRKKRKGKRKRQKYIICTYIPRLTLYSVAVYAFMGCTCVTQCYMYMCSDVACLVSNQRI